MTDKCLICGRFCNYALAGMCEACTDKMMAKIVHQVEESAQK